MSEIAAITSPSVNHSHLSLWAIAWRKLLRKPEAVFSIIVIVIFIFLAFFGPSLAPHSLWEVNFGQDYLPPAWITENSLGMRGNPDFLLGTDTLGRDILTWGLYGTRSSMLLGLISTPLIGLLGGMIGLLAGYAGGKTDNVIMRIGDVFQSFPAIMLYILIVMALRDTAVGQWLDGLFILFVAFLTVGWVSIARLVRAAVLQTKQYEYVEAARSIGAGDRRIIFRHIMPNILSPLLVWMAYTVPQLILVEAILGYLGIGLGRSMDRTALLDISWGGMFLTGRHTIYIQPMLTIVPTVCVGLIAVSFTLLGDALRDSLDPEQRG
ncbi:MAG: ABC transporter permease [Anaerolineaceae bacterium]|nr:ABC transporter permease [Anaerolineaceae bacterium]